MASTAPSRRRHIGNALSDEHGATARSGAGANRRSREIRLLDAALDRCAGCRFDPAQDRRALSSRPHLPAAGQAGLELPASERPCSGARRGPAVRRWKCRQWPVLKKGHRRERRTIVFVDESGLILRPPSSAHLEPARPDPVLQYASNRKSYRSSRASR